MESLIFAISKPRAQHWAIRFPFDTELWRAVAGFSDSHRPVPYNMEVPLVYVYRSITTVPQPTISFS